MFDFVSRTMNLNFPQALEHVAGALGIPMPEKSEPVKVVERISKDADITDELVDSLHAKLMANKKRLEYLITGRLWAEDIIVAAKIGWLSSEQRYTIPVYDDAGEVIDIRKYDPGASGVKDYPWRAGLDIGKRVWGLHLTGPITPGRTVYITEGINDCLALLSHGFASITNILGSTCWPKDCDLRVDDCVVHVVEDHDQAGRDRGRDLTDWFFERGARRVYRLRCGDRGDEKGRDATDVLRSVDSTDPVQRCAAFLEREAVAVAQKKRVGLLHDATPMLTAEFPARIHLVERMLPASGLAVFAGHPKIGKSTVATNSIVRGVINGTDVFGRKAQKGRVLYLFFEESEQAIQDLLVGGGWTSAEAAMLSIHWQQPDLGKLEDWIDETQCSLAVIDTVKRACATSDVDWADYAKTVKLYGKLDEIALRHDVCILALDHHNKAAGRDEAEEDPTRDIHGSTAIGGAVQSAMGLYRRRNDVDARLRIQGRGRVGETMIPVEFDETTLTYQLGDPHAEVMALKHSSAIVESIQAGRGFFSEILVAVGGEKFKGITSTTITKLEDAGVVDAHATADGTRYWRMRSDDDS